MKTIEGTYTFANIFTTNNEAHAIEDYALAQIKMICDQEASKGCRIRVMPDVHPGKVGPIGLTQTIGDKIIPNLVGIDIGCGMNLIQIKNKKVEYQKLDTVIREHIPSGFSIRNTPHHIAECFDFSALHCVDHIQKPCVVSEASAPAITLLKSIRMTKEICMLSFIPAAGALAKKLLNTT